MDTVPDFAASGPVPTGNSPWGRARIRTASGSQHVGDVIGFSTRIAIVALAAPPSVLGGDAVELTLELDGHRTDGIAVTVLQLFTNRDGQPCVAFELPDTTAPARRTGIRFAFSAAVELMVIQGRVTGDPRMTARATNLSAAGIAIRTDRELAPTTTVLARFAVPPDRGDKLQIRCRVIHCRSSDAGFGVGLSFERMHAGQPPLLRAAILALADA